MPGRIRVVSPDGTHGTFPADKPLPAGYRPETDAEALANKDTSKAAALGAARGATLGISDRVLAGAGFMDPRELTALKEYDPKASLAGEVGGTVASAVVGGAGKVGSAVASGAENLALKAGAGRILGKVAAGAAEGGLFGVGSAITEEALDGDHELHAEKLLPNVVGGALAGGALAGGGAVLGAGLKKAGNALVNNLGGETLRNALNDIAESQALKAAGAIKSDSKKYGLSNADERSEIARYALDKLKIGRFDSAEEVAQKAVAASDEHGAKIGEILKQVQGRQPEFNTPRFTARATQELLDPIATDPAKKSTYNALKELIAGYQEFGPGGSAGPMNFEKAWELQSSLRKKLGLGDSLFAAKEELPKLRQIFRDEIINQAEAVSPHYGAMLRPASRDYRSSEVLEQIAKGAMERKDLNAAVSLTDRIAGAGGLALAGGPKGLALGAVAGMANKLARERGSALLAVTADELANGQVLPRIANALSKTIKAGMDSSPDFGGPFRQVLERAAARGSDELLAAHVQLAKQNPDYLASVGMSDETPQAANEYAVQAHKLGAVQDALDAQDARLNAAIGRFLGTQAGAAPKYETRDNKTMRAEFDTRVAQLHKLVTNASAMMDAVNPGELGQVAPNIAASLGAKTAQAAQFLFEKAPKNPNDSPLKQLAAPWRPSDQELARWYRYVDAVENPEKVLADMRHGIVAPESAEALQVVYPKLIADLQMRMMERIASYSNPLSYKQKVALSQLLGVPVGGVGNPEATALLQKVHEATMQQQPSTGGAKGPTSAESRRDNLATQSQRIEGR